MTVEVSSQQPAKHQVFREEGEHGLIRNTGERAELWSLGLGGATLQCKKEERRVFRMQMQGFLLMVDGEFLRGL